MKKAIAIIDGLQEKYQKKLEEAKAKGNQREIEYWQAYLSALTMAAMELEKNK